MIRLDQIRHYCIVCYRGSSTMEQHVGVTAHDAADAFERLRRLGYVPVAVWSVN